MTAKELGLQLRMGLFSDRGTDVKLAFEDAYAIANASTDSQAVLTALHIVTNTIANVLIEMEPETSQQTSVHA